MVEIAYAQGVPMGGELTAGAKRELASGALRPSSLALLTDRVKINLGELQIYGSQLQCVDGSYSSKPVEDPASLDERRASVGLPPFAEYAAHVPGCGNKIEF